MFLLLSATLASADTLDWKPWSDDVFATAKAHDHLVLLDLGAAWCHWCHVMDEQTYGDPVVSGLLHAHFETIRVDQESRPDIASRYEDYGWPATILFDASGNELARLRGYIPPERMASILTAFVADPTPGPSVTGVGVRGPPTPGSGTLPQPLFDQMLATWNAGWDDEHAGWGFVQKYLDPDSVEYALLRARGGDATAARQAARTLAAQRAIFDPVWGGVYQYSTGGVWTEPHFEKIMWVQADDLRIYALAAAEHPDPALLDAVHEIERYLAGFLTSPDGAFYTSQDADSVPGEHGGDFFALDDAGRRARPMPRVDTHIYSRENGWAIRGLAQAFAATGDPDALHRATRAADWVIAHRSLRDGAGERNGGFSHGDADAVGPFLGDTLAMGQATLALYGVTADRRWLQVAMSAADFIDTRFRAPGDAGLLTSVPHAAGLAPVVEKDENVAVARFANLLWRYTGRASDEALADCALRWLTGPETAVERPVAGTLLAAAEAGTSPLHVTVVGSKHDARAAALFRAAIAVPTGYRRVEWWDRAEGPLPNADVDYPELDAPAAFVCSASACSSPAFDVATLEAALARQLAP